MVKFFFSLSRKHHQMRFCLRLNCFKWFLHLVRLLMNHTLIWKSVKNNELFFIFVFGLASNLPKKQSVNWCCVNKHTHIHVQLYMFSTRTVNGWTFAFALPASHWGQFYWPSLYDRIWWCTFLTQTLPQAVAFDAYRTRVVCEK